MTLTSELQKKQLRRATLNCRKLYQTKKLCREKIQKTEAMIDIEIEQKNALTKAIENIQKRKRKISS